MKNLARRTKKYLAILLSILMVVSVMAVGMTASAADITLENVTAITSGDTYVLAMESITPVGMTSGTYVLKNTLPKDTPNFLDFQTFDQNAVDETMMWIIREAEGGYTFSPYDRPEMYLNVSSSALVIASTPQALSVDWTSGQIRITGNGRYVRFTNSATIAGVASQSCFTQGTNTASSTFRVYKATVPEPTPPEPPTPQVEYTYSLEAIGGLDALEDGGSYVFAMQGITDADSVSGIAAMKSTLPQDTANFLDYAWITPGEEMDAIDETMVWTVVSENGGYVLTSQGKSLNVSSSGISVSDTRQALTLSSGSDSYGNSIRVVGGGVNVRFTNSATIAGVARRSCFTQGTGTASSLFTAYKINAIPHEVEPEVEYTYSEISALADLEDGETYIFTMKGINDADGVSGEFSMMNTLPQETPNFLDYEPFNAVTDPDSVKDADLWIVGVEDGGYTLSPVDRPNMYLNVSSSGLVISETKQALTVTWTTDSNGNYIRITGNGRNVRFTNSATIGGVASRSCYTQGTSTNSASFSVYKRIANTVIPEPPEPPIEPPTGEPFFTLAAMSDTHIDYGIQDWTPPIRTSAITTLNYIKQQNVNALVLLGDITSNNAGRTWTKAKHDNVMSNLSALTTDATGSKDKVLFVTGNHDFVAGGTSYNSGDYRPYMNSNFEHVIYQDNTQYHVLGYHVIIDGVDFVGINTPNEGGDKHNDYYYYESSTEWLDWVLDEIGADKTVFVLAHYPLNDSNNISAASKGMSNTHNTQTLFKTAMKNHPNAILLYGHDHGGWQIKTDTYERVTVYDANGNPTSEKTNYPQGFVSSFVGSMGYYVGSLTANDVESIQNLMIYMYEDRIVLQMVNHGQAATGGTDELASYTIMRDLSAYTEVPHDIRLSDVGENEEFTFTVETPNNAESLRLYNENGRIIGIKNVSSEKDGSKKIWTVTTSFGTAGNNRELNVKYRNQRGETVELGYKYFINVIKVDTGVLDADFGDEIYAGVRTPVTITTTQNAQNVAIYNSNGGKISLKSVSKVAEGDTYVWTAEIEIGTKGKDRVFTTKALGDGGKILELTKDVTVDVVATPPQVFSMAFEDDVVEANAPARILLTTSKDASVIKILNSRGMKISSTVESRTVNGDVCEWVIVITIGTPGENREFTAVPVDSSGVPSAVTASDTITVVRPAAAA